MRSKVSTKGKSETHRLRKWTKLPAPNFGSVRGSGPQGLHSYKSRRHFHAIALEWKEHRVRVAREAGVLIKEQNAAMSDTGHI
ncbi:uncharacterized protein LOC143265851 isoform X4 [Megachile rotundata]|uniref:uncharacterized protein LOC143265851 isoform X4 n=1 Tax=Megachile rotundata TaxID=143995 RepID=UPI003FD21549